MTQLIGNVEKKNVKNNIRVRFFTTHLLFCAFVFRRIFDLMRKNTKSIADVSRRLTETVTGL